MNRTELERWCAQAPPGALVPAAWVAEALEAEGDTPARPPTPVVATEPASWRTRLWIVPANTRLGVSELTEALGRSRDWAYRHTSPKATHRLPHRKLDGELVFLAGELRAWLSEHEEIVERGRPEGEESRPRLAG
ncbi:MAG TPA: hypothetical protein VML95_02150 [Longimicrobiales bacterium]|nr:hypothetical protein [Longimicrobiales bacterium]